MAGAACLLGSSLKAAAAGQNAKSVLPVAGGAENAGYTTAFFAKIDQNKLETAVRLAAARQMRKTMRNCCQEPKKNAG